MIAPPEVAPDSSWEGVSCAAPPRPVQPEYQELKFTLHRKLLDRINLEALAGIDNEHPQRGPPGGP